MRGMVKYAAKYKNPRLLESGMNCFMGILRGPHLVAHTWASRPRFIFFFLCSPMEKPPSLFRGNIIAQKGAFVDIRNRPEEKISAFHSLRQGFSDPNRYFQQHRARMVWFYP
jgi:hypothetical protein